jgi:superfamily II DNA helicase RecQ
LVLVHSIRTESIAVLAFQPYIHAYLLRSKWQYLQCDALGVCVIMTAADAVAAQRAQLEVTLSSVFGISAGFRPNQYEAVAATLAGKDSMVVLPTGGCM